ncbi:MAG: hypothetical protein WB384_08990 [Candidatus Sulfotelmatobacter sp.]
MSTILKACTPDVPGPKTGKTVVDVLQAPYAVTTDSAHRVLVTDLIATPTAGAGQPRCRGGSPVGAERRGLGLNVVYKRQEDGVWLPSSFGAEFQMRVGPPVLLQSGHFDCGG